MPYTWYVTFEVHQGGALPRRRSPRATKRFATEDEAKDFARDQFSQGLTVYAGTINPHVPRRLIPSSRIPFWLDFAQEPEIAVPDEPKAPRKKAKKVV